MIRLASVIVALIVVVLSAAPAEACNWCHRWFGGGTTANYAPYTAAYAPVVAYVPQTAYRTVYMPTPVVAYSPVTACSPCGGATTVLRPVVSYATRPRLVPYTMLRPVAPACGGCAVPACNSCATPAPVATAAYYTPSLPAPAPCSSCSASYPPAAAASSMVSRPVAVGTPGTVLRSPAPGPNYPNTPTPTYSNPPAQTGTPGLSPIPLSAPPALPPANSTFGDPNAPVADPSSSQPQSRMLFPARPESSNSNTSGPAKALDPEGQDRMTSAPIPQAYSVRQASHVTPAGVPAKASNASKLDDSGWRSARH